MQKIKYCTHKTSDGIDCVQIINDGKCYCPICKQSWTMVEFDKEQVEELVDKLLNQLQLMAWSGAELARLDPSFKQKMRNVIRFLNGFPDLWESAMYPIAPYEIEEIPPFTYDGYSKYVADLEMKRKESEITPEDIEVQFKKLNSMLLQFQKQCDKSKK